MSSDQKKEDGKRRSREIAIARQLQRERGRSSSSSIENHGTTDGANAGAFSARETAFPNDKRSNRKSARHGARNQHRHKHFARWILQTFPHILKDCVNDVDDCDLEQNENGSLLTATNDNVQKRSPMHILDVAGGKGELSARLTLCHSLNVVMIDPRPADISSVYMNSVVPKLPKKWQASVRERIDENPKFIEEELEKRFKQLVMHFSSPERGLVLDHVDCAVESNGEDSMKKAINPSLHEAVEKCSLLIGLHADGATEAIVDMALLYNKPFVVVPCCVFPNLFRERFIQIPIEEISPSSKETGATIRENSAVDENGRNCDSSKSNGNGLGDALDECKQNGTKEVDANDNNNGAQFQQRSITKQIPVRTHDQFCQYLLAKDHRFVCEELPFEGRNVAIWWDGKE